MGPAFTPDSFTLMQSGFFPFMPLMGFMLPLFIALAVWTVAIKGYALWHAARNGHKIWFVALLIVNTVGLLELVYLIWFRNRKSAPIATPPAPSSAGTGA